MSISSGKSIYQTRDGRVTEMLSFKLLSCDLDIDKHNDDVNCIDVFEFGKFKCKIDIRSNVYDFQSHAVGYVWSKYTFSWNYVDSIPFTLMKTPHKLVYDKLITSDMFDHDRKALINKMNSILN